MIGNMIAVREIILQAGYGTASEGNERRDRERIENSGRK